MSKEYNYTDNFGDTFPVTPYIDFYKSNNGIFLGFMAYEDYEEDGMTLEPYCDITVNIEDLPYLYAAIDTTYSGEEKMKFLEENGFGEFTGQYLYSGFCKYPVFHFNEEKLKEIDPEIFAAYAKANGRGEKDVIIEEVKENINAFITAIYDFNKLSEEIDLCNKENLNLQETCVRLNGHNLEKDFFFDVNYGTFCGTVEVKDGKLDLVEDSIELWNEDSCLGNYSLNNIYNNVASYGFEDFLKSLQENEYAQPNVYFAWKKPDESIYMLGFRSGQMGQILEYQYNETFKKYEGRYVSIAKHVDHLDQNGRYDPVERLCENVKGYVFAGGWNDSVRMVEQGYSLGMSYGQWDKAIKHIFNNSENNSLDNKICRAEEKAAEKDISAEHKIIEPERF